MKKCFSSGGCCFIVAQKLAHFFATTHSESHLTKLQEMIEEIAENFEAGK